MPLKVPFMVCVMCSHGHAGVGTLGGGDNTVLLQRELRPSYTNSGN